MHQKPSLKANIKVDPKSYDLPIIAITVITPDSSLYPYL